MTAPGFAIEFITNVIGVHGAPRLERFRVLIADEHVTAYVAFVDAIGEPAWARICASQAHGASPISLWWTSPLAEDCVVALAFRGYANAEHRVFTPSPTGVPIIDIGIVEREV